MRVRAATREDAPALFEMILELAEYERLSDAVRGDAGLLARTVFEERAAEALIAETEDGGAAGYAFFYRTFSTFECRAGLWVEDIYVRPPHRGSGLGRMLLGRIAAAALEQGCPRVEWSALEWNELALGFYDRLGARRLDEWRMLRLEGEALARLGTAGRPGPPAL
jgi:GNAT superfamily N-acetyltransferase